MDILPPQKVKVVPIKGKGRGVVATQDITAGEIIEYCPIMELSDTEVEFIESKSDIIKHYYLIQPEFNKHCLMLGYGCIYNHDSQNPNAEVDYDTKAPQNFLFFRAIKDIKAGEEIVYDYNFDDGKEEFLKLE